jgi:hypothetical protein
MSNLSRTGQMDLGPRNEVIVRRSSNVSRRAAAGRSTAAILAALGLGLLGCGGGNAGNGGVGGTTGGAGSAGNGGVGGASGTAGGAGDASGVDASDGDGGDPCATALFCDDFESYAEGRPPAGQWTAQTNTATIAVDTGEHHSGTKAVRFTTPGTAAFQSAFIALTSVFPVTGNMFYGRMMFFLEAAPTTSVHWTMIQGSGVVPGQSYHAQYRYGGQLPIAAGSQLMANYDTPDSYSGTGPSSDCWNHANGTVVPVGVWSCVEWQFDGGTNTMRLWLDRDPIDSLTVAGVGQGCVHQPTSYSWTAPTFDRLSLGWESYQTDDPRTFWIDDVVVSTTKIGCPP